MRSTNTRTWRRAVPLLSAGSVFAGFATLWLTGSRQIYESILQSLGVPAWRTPFLDSGAIAAALECHRAGINVFRIDPCDVLGRLYAYSPLWLRADFLPVTTGWTPYIGLTFASLFFWALTQLPEVRGGLGLLLIAAASVSPPVLFALERGNNDLIVFALAATAMTLFQKSAMARLLGTATVAFAAALKYYPGALLIGVLREQPRRCILLIGTTLAVLALAVLLDFREVLAALRCIPTGNPFSRGFSATVIPFGLRDVLGLPRHMATGLLLALCLGSVSIAWVQARELQNDLADIGDAELTFLTGGAALIVGCFFLSEMNFEYRCIMLLFVIPGLLSVRRLNTSSRRLASITLAIIMFLLWQPISDVLHVWIFVWAFEAVGWWWVVTILAAVLWHAVLSSPFVQAAVSAVQTATWPWVRQEAVRNRSRR